MRFSKNANLATNAIDDNEDIYFALEGGVEDGHWKCNIPNGKTVGRIEIKAVENHEDELSGAIIYLG